MPDPLVTYSTRRYLNTTTYDTIDGTGYRIGDDYVLTAGHVYFEWNRDSTNVVLNDIWAAGSNFLDYREYRSQYLAEVGEELSAGSPYSTNRAIEGRIGARDTIVIRRSGDVGSSGDGLVVFLDHADLTRVGSVLDATASVSRIDTSPGAADHGTVVSTTSAGNLFFSSASVEGDSGGAYLLSYGDREYVIGTHAGNTTDHGGSAVGTYFTYSEWQQINDLLEAGHSGNVTSSEPTNLVVGKATDDVIAGSFRADILLGRGGDDHLMDGDVPDDTVWANDTLIGGAGNDEFTAGAGNDTIWGGDKDNDQGVADGADTVDYSTAIAGITIRFSGTDSVSSLTIQDGQGGTDTLHSIETIVATPHTDYLFYSGEIPDDYAPGGSRSLTIDMGDGADVVTSADGATTAIALTIDEQGAGTLKGDGPGVINLLHARTHIVGSAYDDEITDLSVHDGSKRVDGGAGNDVIIVDGSRATVFGGAGDDVLTGGSGNDILYGEGGVNEIHGGAGSDILVSANDAAWSVDYVWSGMDLLYGGAGSDRFVLSGIRAEIEGGAGDDIIEMTAPWPGTAVATFRIGDGHDLITSSWDNSFDTVEAWAGNYLAPRHPVIVRFEDISRSEVELVWDATEYAMEINGEMREIAIGDLAVVILATGESVLFQNVINWAPTFDEDRPYYVGWGGAYTFPTLIFSDGAFKEDDGSTNVRLRIGSTSAYATAADAFALEQAAGGSLPPGAQTGTPGHDEIAGSYGDDMLDGGDGDDAFTESGGEDSYEGGLGLNTLNLFGSPSEYLYSEESGQLSIANPRTGGKMTLANIEFVSFTAEAATLTAAELLTMVGTEGDDILVGSAFGDALDGLGGNDSLQGGLGDDSLHGGDGNDAIDGEEGDDLLNGGAGDDVLDGGDGDDTFVGLEGVDEIDGGAGEDRLVLPGTLSDYSFVPTGDGGLVYGPGGGYDSAFLSSVESVYFEGDDALVPLIELTAIHGTEEGDLLAGFERADWIFGHGGDDLVFGSGGADLLYGGDGADTLYGGTGDDLLDGGDGDDLLVGDEGDDTLRGSAGADLLTAGDGEDRVILSGTRADYLFVWDYGSVIVERPDDGPLTLISVEAIYFEGEDLLVPILDLVAINGTGAADTLVGTAARDLILGHGGDDTIHGNDGDDEIDGGDGVDTAHYAGASVDFWIARVDEGSISVGDNWGSEGWDALAGVEYLYFAGDDVLLAVADLPALGTEGEDVIVGSDRGDSLTGEGGDDSITGLGGNDSISGGSGADLMSGGAGDDEYYVDDAGDVVVEDADEGFDFVVASVDFTMPANVDGLMIYGDATAATGNALDNFIGANSMLASHLRGLAGDDNLGGGQSGDILEGGDGADGLVGWGGADIFLYQAVSESTVAAFDTIYVFEPGADTIDLGEIDADAASIGDQAFTFIGGDEFSGGSALAPGELRAFLVADTLWHVEGDLDLDGIADFLIHVMVDGAEPLTSGDFLL